MQDAIVNTKNWEDKGINIDGEHLSHLIFADDIVLVAKSPEEQQRRACSLAYTSPANQ